ncbi:VOC family protein [Sutcliffiella deserti]|uniref:VOC family protein n=1 Tax=Sutcliffiella deserti TaxID=2875501 RepID=UPI001CBFDA67|nr:VOC family protein [Sutcliffiella deserti]
MEFHQRPHVYVGEVVIKVANLEKSLSFYKEIMGFGILERTDQKATLTADGAKPLITIEQPEIIKPKNSRTTGLYHFALLLPERKFLGSFIQHLIKKNYPVQGGSDHLVSEALYLSDPDGNGIEVYIDRPWNTWEWVNGEVKMTSEPLDIQNLLFDAEGSKWEGLPPDTLMGHIHLHVSDLNSIEEFYTKALGFKVVNRYGNQALFISTGEYHHHIGLNTWNGVGAPQPEDENAGLHYFTLILPSEEAKVKVVEELNKFGATIRKDGNSLFTTDPSGNKICLRVIE